MRLSPRPFALLAVLAAPLAAAESAPVPEPAAEPPASAPYVKDPRYWPTPVMDTVPPPLPTLGKHAVLVFSKTNGFRDDEQIRAANAALQALVEAQGRHVFVTENAAVFNPRDLARFDVVVLNSTSGDTFLPAQRAAFRQWLERGGGLVALHGAGGDHHYDWDWYVETVLGAQFIGHTSRPKQFRQGVIDVAEPRHPAMRALPARWQREEEWYAFDRVPSGHHTRILARLDESSYGPAPEQRMGDHPIVWTRCIGRGRVFYSALGRKAQTYAEPLHLGMIDGALAWAAGARTHGCD